MRDQFKFYMKAGPATYYYVSGSQVLTTNAPVSVSFGPMDWNKIDLRWSRNIKYHGLMRTLAFPVALVTDAATIARHVYYNVDGIAGKCMLEVHELDTTTQQYEFLFNGYLNFGKPLDRVLYFQCDLVDGGLTALLKAKSNIPLEIALTTSNSLSAYFDGIRLRNSTTVELANDISATNVWHQMMPTIRIQSSESQVQVDVIAQPQQVALGTTELYQKYPFFKATIAGIVTIEYDIAIQLANPASTNLAGSGFAAVIWQINTANTAVVATQFLYNESNYLIYMANPVAAKGSKSFNLQAGEKLVYFAGLTPFDSSQGSNAFLIAQTYQYSTLGVKYDLRLPASIVPGMRYGKFFELFIDKLTEGKYAGVSSYLNNANLVTYDARPYNTLVSSGDGVRGLGTAAKPAMIKTNLEEMFADATAKWMMGLGVEVDANGNEVARFEHRSYFYRKDDVMLVLPGLVSDFEVEEIVEDQANLYKCGTSDSTYDGLNGRDEPNIEFQFALPIDVSTDTIDQISPYRADMYGIEILRSNLANKKTTDSSSDNDTFTFEVESKPFTANISLGNIPILRSLTAYRLARPQNVTGNGASGLIASDTAFNLMDSPKRRLLRNGSMLRGFLNQQLDKSITFQTSEKNSELSSNLGSGLITEKAPVRVGDLAAPLYLSKIFRFTTPVPKNIGALISATPYGVIEFTVELRGRRQTLRGFIRTLISKPGTKAASTWELLPVPDTDLSKLYR